MHMNNITMRIVLYTRLFINYRGIVQIIQNKRTNIDLGIYVQKTQTYPLNPQPTLL